MQTVNRDHRRRATRAVTVTLPATMLVVALACGAQADESGQRSEQAHVVMSGRVDVAADETTRDIVVLWGLRGLGVSWICSWLAVSVSALALGLLLALFAPRAVDAALRTARTRPGVTIVAGLGVGVVPFLDGLALIGWHMRHLGRSPARTHLTRSLASS